MSTAAVCDVQRSLTSHTLQGSTFRAPAAPATYLVQQRKIEALHKMRVRHVTTQVLGVFVGHVAQVALLWWGGGGEGRA